MIGDNVKITVLKIKGNTVRLGIEAPRDVHVVRGELEPKLHTRVVDVPVDNQEDQYGNFTVVFSNSDNESPQVDVVPFDSSETKSDSGRNETTSVQSVEPKSEIAESISFRNRIPKSMQHNRLKEIVNELSKNNQ